MRTERWYGSCFRDNRQVFNDCSRNGNGNQMTAQQTFRNTLIVLATLAGAYALYTSARILIVLLAAIIVDSAARPAVLVLKNRGLSEGSSILAVYLLIAFALFVLVAAVLPPTAQQISGYLSDNQGLAQRIIDAQEWLKQTIKDRTGQTVVLFDPNAIRDTVATTIGDVKRAFPALAGQFGGFFGDFVLVFVMGVYWLTARDQAVKFVLQLFPIGRRAEWDTMIQEIEYVMGTYVRGIILVATFVGVANFIILSLLGVPGAVTLGFIVGTTTALPIIGGYIGAFTATLVALLSGPDGPKYALFAFASFVAVQQIENHYLTPRVMSRSVRLNPILIIVFLFIGFALGGVIGALIAVPIAGMFSILLRHLVIQPRKDEAAPKYVDGGILLPSSASTNHPKPPAATVLTPEAAHGPNPGT